MDTVKKSRTPSVVLTASGEMQTHEEAQMFVHDLNLFVTVQLLDETPAVPFARQALRRPRIPLWVAQRSRTFQGSPPFLKASRLLHRYHRTRWEKRRYKHPGNLCNMLQIHLQVQSQSEVTNSQPRHWCHSQKFKTKIKRRLTGRIRKNRWHIFLTG